MPRTRRVPPYIQPTQASLEKACGVAVANAATGCAQAADCRTAQRCSAGDGPAHPQEASPLRARTGVPMFPTLRLTWQACLRLSGRGDVRVAAACARKGHQTREQLVRRDTAPKHNIVSGVLYEELGCASRLALRCRTVVSRQVCVITPKTPCRHPRMSGFAFSNLSGRKSEHACTARSLRKRRHACDLRRCVSFDWLI